MNDAHDIPGTPDDVPGKHVTVNQIVGFNVARWRKAAGMAQRELGEILGWSIQTVSAAERSWDGKRIRQFDADDILALCVALQIPIAALFLPPSDDGAKVRYLFHVPERDPNCLEMGSLFSLLMPEATGEGPAEQAWQDAYVAASNRYLDPGRGADLIAYLEDLTTAERMEQRLARISRHREALLEAVGDLDQIATAIERKIHE